MRRLLFLLTAVLLMMGVFADPAAAQGGGSGMGGGMSVSRMSNQQILMMWQQAKKGGVSESEAMKQLVGSGINPSEVNAFKRRLLQAQSAAGSNKSDLVSDTAGFLKDTSWVRSVPQMKRISPYYGFDMFSNPDVTFEPNLSINPPRDYVLGNGDELTLNLTGLNERTINDKIKRDGTFQLPYAGIVTLAGLTMEQAEQTLKSKLKMAYPGLVTGQTQLTVTIDNARYIKIQIIGEAARPGTFTVSSLSGFFNVLYLSGGPSAQGSLRKIELIRNNKVVSTVDFYGFLQKGIFDKAIRLEDQDIIRIPVYNKRVELDGAVKRPAIYELLDKETLADLINYAGGFEGDAYRENAKVVQVGGRERRVRDISSIDFANFMPQDADSVHISRTLTTFLNRVVISGAVQRPGNYELTDGLTLTKLISKADGLREDAFTSLGYVNRKRSGLDGEREQLSFNLKTLQANSAADLKLVKDDSIFIPSRDSLRDVPSITVGGNVRAPGVFEFRKGMSLEEAIVMAGGFTNDAATHKVEISRLEKNRADTLANQLMTTIKVDVDSTLTQPSGHTLLQPLDYIFVPRLLNYRMLGNVQIKGEVLNPGDYTLERRDETVQDLVNRAGGVSPYASIGNTQVFRNGVRIATTILAGKGGNERFPLLPGDSIFIPRDIPFVEVRGAVFNPQLLKYETGNDFIGYISAAGGVTDNARLSRAYIQYSNGVNKRISHFLFFRRYPKVLPGSKIIVPERPATERRGLSVVEISALAGVLSAMVGMIAVLK